MNTKYVALVAILCVSAQIKCQAIDYINTYLPETSEIRRLHNTEKPRFCWFGPNRKSACDNINHLLSIAASTKPTAFGWLAAAATAILGGSQSISSDAQAVTFNQISCLLDKSLEEVLSGYPEDVQEREKGYVGLARNTIEVEKRAAQEAALQNLQ